MRVPPDEQAARPPKPGESPRNGGDSRPERETPDASVKDPSGPQKMSLPYSSFRLHNSQPPHAPRPIPRVLPRLAPLCRDSGHSRTGDHLGALEVVSPMAVGDALDLGGACRGSDLRLSPARRPRRPGRT